MVDSLNVPQNLTKVIEIKDNSDQLRKFLIDLLMRVERLEKSLELANQKIKVLENGN